MTIETDREKIAQTLIEGFRVLHAFTASEPELTLGQVADRADLDKETTFRLVQTLVILGYLERISGTKQFRLTLKLLELGFFAIVQNQESFFSDSAIDNSTQS
jgi:IclR family pca regulon transcriptional regulator